jgi:hypothetical protein
LKKLSFELTVIKCCVIALFQLIWCQQLHFCDCFCDWRSPWPWNLSVAMFKTQNVLYCKACGSLLTFPWTIAPELIPGVVHWWNTFKKTLFRKQTIFGYNHGVVFGHLFQTFAWFNDEGRPSMSSIDSQNLCHLQHVYCRDMRLWTLIIIG